MHFISLTSIAFLGLSVIAPLVVAHPADTSSKVVSHKPTPYKAPPHKTSPKVQPHKTTAAAVSTPTSDPTWADLEAECYHVSSPKCDKAYAEFEAAYLKAHPGYNTVEPYPDSKRKSNVCKCTGSLLDGGYKVSVNESHASPSRHEKRFGLTGGYIQGVCKYGDGFGYVRITSPPVTNPIATSETPNQKPFTPPLQTLTVHLCRWTLSASQAVACVAPGAVAVMPSTDTAIIALPQPRIPTAPATDPIPDNLEIHTGANLSTRPPNNRQDERAFRLI